MSFLPVVQRELGVAVRRRNSLRLRWRSTALALAFGFLAFAAAGSSTNRGSAGAKLFELISWYAFILCLLSGAFLTSDSISREKRDGTLGLLFLSDLKGHDVVLGKFVGLALNAFYCLLALLPVAALALILGGVTGGQFWRTALALAEVLFFSMALGICVSVFAREPQGSLSATVGLLLLLAVGCPLLAWTGRKILPSPIWTGLGFISPTTVLSLANEPGYFGHAARFWGALLGSGFAGCCFIAIASMTLSRSWRWDSSPRREAGRGVIKSVRQRARKRGEFLTQNPIRWLTRCELGVQWAAWAVVAGWAVLVVIAVTSGLEAASSPWLGSLMVRPFGFLLKLLFGIQATRFFAESRQNGTLSLLLCTRLTSWEIVRGTAAALWGAFLWPLVVFIALLFAPVAIWMTEALVARNFDQAFSVFSSSLLSGWFAIRLALDLLALCWFGMALALTSRRPNLSPGLTILFVLILPTVLSICALDMVADIVFISWGLSKLRDLRQLIAPQSYPAPAGPSVVPGKPLIQVPPLIPR